MKINHFVLAFALFFVACGWKPNVESVPISEPWKSYKLPVENANSIVFRSDAGDFRAVHKGSDPKVINDYATALKAAGWQVGEMKTSAEDSALAQADVTKGAEAFTLRAYKFDGSSTAVAIEKK